MLTTFEVGVSIAREVAVLSAFEVGVSIALEVAVSISLEVVVLSAFGEGVVREETKIPETEQEPSFI